MIFFGALQHHADHGSSTVDEIDDDGWFRFATAIPSERTQKLATPTGLVEGITWHWTATGAGTARRMAENIRKRPEPGQHVGSWHVCIERDGSAYQSVPLTLGSWHAGGPSARRFRRDPNGTGWQIAEGAKLSANAWSMGIELVCVGEVRQVGGRWMGWPFGRDGKRGPIVEAFDVTESGGRHYQRFTPEQVATATRIVRAMLRELPASPDDRALSWGHRDIDPGRKDDPGPIWVDILPKILADARSSSG